MKKTLNLQLWLALTALPGLAFTQTSPGGVSSALKLWVQSNTGVSATGGLVDSWTYVNDGTKLFTSTGTDRPTLTSSVINFNPVLRFAGSQLMDGPTGVNAPITAGDDDYTAFVVWRSNSTTTFQRIWEQRSTCGFCNDAFALSTWDATPPGPGVYGDETATAPFSQGIQRNYAASRWNISQLNLLNQATNDLEIVDNRNIGTGIMTLNTDPGGSPNGAGLRTLSDAINRMGANFDNTSFLDGDIAEIIVYDRPISGTERSQVFSYLALKYGITIKTDLLSSTGTTVWDATANATYNNNVFGLARDNNSGLLITQSNNMETGSGNGAGQSGQANVVLSNPSALTADLTFLTIGNDNGALTESTSDLPAAAAGSMRLQREWKVQEIGNLGTTTVSIDLTGLTVNGVNPIDFRLIVDADGNGDFTNGTIRYYTAASYSGGVATFNNVTLNNNEVFTFITSASVTTPLPVYWKSFTGKLVNQQAQLNWQVGNNESAKDYEIEYSSDGQNFTQVGIVPNQTGITNYSYSYSRLAYGNNYFRIRQVDFDGKFVYSTMVVIKWNGVSMVVLNNPIRNNYVDVQINAAKAGKASVELRTLTGVALISEQHSLSVGLNKVRIPMTKASNGNYILRIEISGDVYTEKLIKL